MCTGSRAGSTVVSVLLEQVCLPLRTLASSLLQEPNEVGVGIEEELCEA